MKKYIYLENYNQRLMAKALFCHYFDMKEDSMSGAFLEEKSKYHYFQLSNTLRGNLGVYSHLDMNIAKEDYEVYYFDNIDSFIAEMLEEQKALTFEDLEVGEFFTVNFERILRKKVSNSNYTIIFSADSGGGLHRWMEGETAKINKIKNLKITFDIEE